MKLTRRKFIKSILTALAAWGIVPAALLKSADKVPSFEGWHVEDIDIANQKGVAIGTRIISGRPVRFNSKDYGVVIIK
jgi:hypothetical protein